MRIRVNFPPYFPLVLGLALLAAWLRLRSLGYTEIAQDQAVIINHVLGWIHGGPAPLVSIPTSIGFFNPPLAEYLFAIPLLLSPDILGIVWLIALINLIGIAIAGYAVSRIFGRNVALWSTLLFVVNPVAAYFARWILLPSLVPAFASMLFACVLLYFAEQPRALYASGAALALSAAIQCHLSAFLLVPVLVLALACFPHRLRLRPLSIALAAFVVSFTPTILFELRSNFFDGRVFLDMMQRPSTSDWTSLRIARDILHSEWLYFALGPAANHLKQLDWAGPAVDGALTLLYGGAFLLALATVAINVPKIWRRMELSSAVIGQTLSVLWLIVPILATIRHPAILLDYYFLYLFPVPFVLLALLSVRTVRWIRTAFTGRILPARLIATLPFLLLGLIALQQTRLIVISQNGVAAGWAGRERVMDVRRLIKDTLPLMADRPQCRFVVISEHGTADFSRFALLSEFIGPSRVTFFAQGAGLPVPNPCAVFMLAVDDPFMKGWLDATAFPLPQNTLQTPEQTWLFYDLPAARRKLLDLGAGSLKAEWQDGLRLRTWEVEGSLRPGSDLQLRTTWEVSRPIRPHLIQFGHYLFDSGDTMIAQSDGSGWDSRQWQMGDIFLTHFTIGIPRDTAPGEYRLAMSRYYYPEILNLPLAREGGTILNLGTVTISP